MCRVLYFLSLPLSKNCAKNTKKHMALNIVQKSKGIWASKSYSSLVYFLPILILGGLVFSHIIGAFICQFLFDVSFFWRNSCCFLAFCFFVIEARFVLYWFVLCRFVLCWFEYFGCPIITFVCAMFFDITWGRALLLFCHCFFLHFFGAIVTVVHSDWRLILTHI